MTSWRLTSGAKALDLRIAYRSAEALRHPKAQALVGLFCFVFTHYNV
jgi:hypothetical protein